MPGHADAVAERVDLRRLHVVVEPAPVVPGDEDRRRAPVRRAHDRVHDPRHPGLAAPDRRRRVLAVCMLGTTHETLGSVPAAPSGRIGATAWTFAAWSSACTSMKCGSGFQMLGVSDVLRVGAARHVAVGAVRLDARLHVVAPGDVVLRQQVGEVCPGVAACASVAGAALRSQPSTERQLIGSVGDVHDGRPARHQRRCEGRLQPRSDGNMWSCSTKWLRVGPVVGDLARGRGSPSRRAWRGRRRRRAWSGRPCRPR